MFSNKVEKTIPQLSMVRSRGKTQKLRGLLSTFPGLLFLALVCLIPVAALLLKSAFAPTFTTEHFDRLLSSAVYVRVVLHTLKISLLVAAVCLLLGYPFAYLMAIAPERWRNILMISVTLPFFTSILVRTYAWMVILGNHGIINELLMRIGVISTPLPLLFNTTGVVIGMVHVLLPYAVLPMYSVLHSMDRSLGRAGASLGAGELRSFLFITLPQSWPGVFAAFLLVFVLSLGFYITPAMLGGQKDIFIAQLIQTEVSSFLNWSFAGVLSILLLGITYFILVIITKQVPAEVLFGAQKNFTFDKAGESHTPRLVQRLAHWLARVLKPLDDIPLTRIVLTPVVIVTVLFLLLPVLVVIPLSFTSAPYLTFPPPGYSLQWYAQLMSSLAWKQAAINSLVTAGLSTCIALALGTLAAFGITRGNFPGRNLVYGLFLSPLIIPAMVLGVSIYRVFLPLGLVNSLGALAVAHAALGLPVVIMVISSVLKGLDPALERAAASLGASPIRTFRSVTLPLIRPGLVSGAVFAFLLSFDELVITLFVGGANTVTLPLKMWEGTREELSPVLAAVATIMLAISCIGFLVAEWVKRSQNKVRFGK